MKQMTFNPCSPSTLFFASGIAGQTVGKITGDASQTSSMPPHAIPALNILELPHSKGMPDTGAFCRNTSLALLPRQSLSLQIMHEATVQWYLGSWSRAVRNQPLKQRVQSLIQIADSSKGHLSPERISAIYAQIIDVTQRMTSFDDRMSVAHTLVQRGLRDEAESIVTRSIDEAKQHSSREKRDAALMVLAIVMAQIGADIKKWGLITRAAGLVTEIADFSKSVEARRAICKATEGFGTQEQVEALLRGQIAFAETIEDLEVRVGFQAMLHGRLPNQELKEQAIAALKVLQEIVYELRQSKEKARRQFGIAKAYFQFELFEDFKDALLDAEEVLESRAIEEKLGIQTAGQGRDSPWDIPQRDIIPYHLKKAEELQDAESFRSGLSWYECDEFQLMPQDVDYSQLVRAYGDFFGIVELTHFLKGEAERVSRVKKDSWRKEHAKRNMKEARWELFSNLVSSGRLEEALTLVAEERWSLDQLSAWLKFCEQAIRQGKEQEGYRQLKWILERIRRVRDSLSRQKAQHLIVKTLRGLGVREGAEEESSTSYQNDYYGIWRGRDQVEARLALDQEWSALAQALSKKVRMQSAADPLTGLHDPLRRLQVEIGQVRKLLDRGEHEKVQEKLFSLLVAMIEVQQKGNKAITAEHVTTHIQVAKLFHDAGRHSEGVRFLKQSMKLIGAWSSNRSKAIHLITIGRVFADWGHDADALENFRRASEALHQMGFTSRTNRGQRTVIYVELIKQLVHFYALTHNPRPLEMAMDIAGSRFFRLSLQRDSVLGMIIQQCLHFAARKGSGQDLDSAKTLAMRVTNKQVQVEIGKWVVEFGFEEEFDGILPEELLVSAEKDAKALLPAGFEAAIKRAESLEDGQELLTAAHRLASDDVLAQVIPKVVEIGVTHDDVKLLSQAVDLTVALSHPRQRNSVQTSIALTIAKAESSFARAPVFRAMVGSLIQRRPLKRLDPLRQLAQVYLGQDAIAHPQSAQESQQAAQALLAERPSHWARYLGALGLTEGMCSELSPTVQAMALLGAARGFRLDHEVRGIRRRIGQQLKKYNDEKAFPVLTTALADLGDDASTQQLMDMAQRWPISAYGQPQFAQLVSRLIETGNQKALGFAGRLLGESTFGQRHRFWLLRKLEAVGYLEKGTVAFLREKEHAGMSRDLIDRWVQSLVRVLGLLPSKEILRFLIKAKVKEEGGRRLLKEPEKIVATLQQRRAFFEHCSDRFELIENLSRRPTEAFFYFLLFGGRTRFALIDKYTSNQFLSMLKAIQRDVGSVDADVLYDFRYALSSAGISSYLEIISRLEKGEWPLEGASYARSLRIDVSSESMLMEIQEKLAAALSASELGAMIEASVAASLLEKEEQGSVPVQELLQQIRKSAGIGELRPFLERLYEEVPELRGRIAQRWERSFGKFPVSIQQLMGLEEQWAIPTPFEMKEGFVATFRGQLIDRERQRKRNARSDAKADYDARIAHWESAPPEEVVVGFVEMLLSNGSDGNLIHRDEFKSHLKAMYGELERIAGQSGKEKRVTLRYLDKRTNMVECLRIADAAQCCFTSENRERYERWVSRIWKDPLSFAFLIEDNEPDAAERHAIGFVFGSFGVKGGEPAVLLNGVYMQGKTNEAVLSILEAIEQDFSRPLGAGYQMVAATYGGQTHIDPKHLHAAGRDVSYSNRQTSVRRLRALKNEWGDSEGHIYDDLDVGLNKESMTRGHVWWKMVR